MRRKFDFNDFALVPETISSINSRSEIDVEINGMLPIMVSPMDTVVNLDNFEEFHNQDLTVCIPRGLKPLVHYNHFTSISLDDFAKYVVLNVPFKNRVLVDIANGHMERLHSLCKKFLENNPHSEIMVGNIANPETYKKFAEIGVKYVRVGIGGGSACLTSANTGVHYPVASLIKECYEIKKEFGFETKIVADGGFRNYDEIIKALALGADYVMLGGVLNKTLESCSKTKLFNLIPVSPKVSFFLWDKFPYLRNHFYKEFRGMSTKAVQKKWGKSKIKTSEGIHKTNKVEYRLEGWVKNFEDYLKSAMSYTNSRNLESFKESQIVFITENALKRYKK
jgi:IMP dehydrogenase/GMP reductase